MNWHKIRKLFLEILNQFLEEQEEEAQKLKEEILNLESEELISLAVHKFTSSL